jgi:hypothetical protein
LRLVKHLFVVALVAVQHGVPGSGLVMLGRRFNSRPILNQGDSRSPKRKGGEPGKAGIYNLDDDSSLIDPLPPASIMGEINRAGNVPAGGPKAIESLLKTLSEGGYGEVDNSAAIGHRPCKQPATDIAYSRPWSPPVERSRSYLHVHGKLGHVTKSRNYLTCFIQ